MALGAAKTVVPLKLFPITSQMAVTRLAPLRAAATGGRNTRGRGAKFAINSNLAGQLRATKKE